MHKNRVIYILLLAVLIIFPDIASAQNKPSIPEMFSNFSASSVALTRVAQYFMNIMGLFLVVGSVFKLAEHGKTGGQIPLKMPIIMLLCGIALWTGASTINVVAQTLYGDGPGNLLSPPGAVSPIAQLKEGITGILLFLRFIGYVAFIRGWLILNKLGGQGGDGMLSRGLTHIFGGVALIQVEFTAKILSNSLAPGMANLFN